MSLSTQSSEDLVPRVPGSIPDKGVLVFSFPLAEKRFNVHKSAYDDKNNFLYIVLSDANVANVAARIQVYKIEGSKFVKIEDKFFGRVGGLAVLKDTEKVLITVVKNVTAQYKWEAILCDVWLSKASCVDTSCVPQPSAESDAWCICEAGQKFYIACPEFDKIHEYKKTKADENNCVGEIKCEKLKNLDAIGFFEDMRRFVTMHRDKASRWADDVNYHAFVYSVRKSSVVVKLCKIDNVHKGMFTIFDMSKIIISRKIIVSYVVKNRPQREQVNLQLVDVSKPDDILYMRILCDRKIVQPLAMAGKEKLVVYLDNTDFGLMQLSFNPVQQTDSDGNKN